MSDLGDRFVSTTFYDKFTTVNGSGVPTTLGSSPSLQFYVGAGTTAFTAGLSLDADFNGVTGLNHVTVIATTSATAWTSGIDVQVVVATGTVSGISIKGYTVCTFSLQNRAGLRPTVAGRTLDVSSGGEAGLDWANIGSPTTAQNLSATNIDVDQVVASVSGAVGSVTGAVGSVTGAVGSVTGNVGGNVVGSVASVTGNVGGNVVGSVASVTGNVGGNVTGSVGSVVGAVGSVTGNVGGNVVGSVGSVTGAVGSVTGNVGGNVVGSVASVVAAVAITSNIKKNQALAGFEFLMTDSTTHAPQTGLTVTVTRSIDGGAFGAGTLSAVSEVGNGVYSVDFGAGDLNGNVIVLQANAAAADTTFERLVTQP